MTSYEQFNITIYEYLNNTIQVCLYTNLFKNDEKLRKIKILIKIEMCKGDIENCQHCSK